MVERREVFLDHLADQRLDVFGKWNDRVLKSGDLFEEQAQLFAQMRFNDEQTNSVLIGLCMQVGATLKKLVL